jgi:long-chain acyl-CoA synthetase
MYLPKVLHDHRDRCPERPVFFSGDETWSHERLASAAERLASAFVRVGVRRGDRIALHMPNLPELVTAYYACFLTGAIAAPLSLRAKTAELAPLLARLKPALYLGHDELFPTVAELDPQILAAERRFVVGASGASQACDWRDLVSDGSIRFRWRSPDLDAPALLLHTSGTTGVPKLVTHTLRTFSAIADSSAHLGVDGAQIGVLALPMVHISGAAAFFGCLRWGAPVVLLERFDADAVLDAIERHGGTWLPGLPFMAGEILDRQRARPRDIASLRNCIVVGDVCPPGLQEEFRAVFAIPLGSFWASSEAVGVLTPGPCDGAVSSIAPGAEVRLVDENGVPVRRGEVGELAVRGPNVTIGYWTAPGQITGAHEDGWLRTGDLMRQDDQGHCWFVSRRKELIIRGGSNIASVEVERVLRSHPAVRDAAVIGMPDPRLGQRVAAFVQLAPGVEEEALAAVRTHVAAHLADYKVPERWQIVEAVPRNAQGKIDRNQLSTMLQTDPQAPQTVDRAA